MVLLGEEWVVQPETDPLAVPGFAEQDIVEAKQAEVQHQDNLERLLAQLAETLSQPAPPAPVVSTSPPMTVDTTGLVAAFSQALAALPPSPDTTAELALLAKTLDKLDRRVAGGALSGGPGGGVSNALLEQIRDRLGQLSDPLNTGFLSVTTGASAFTGTFSPTDSRGVIRVLTVLASNVTSGLGGTFNFQFSDNGVSNNGINETRTITDFSTVRDFDLENFGAYYMCTFTPSRPLVGGEQVFITTRLSRSYSGQFVRLANQQIEEANAAMGETFAYLKGFDPRTGKSVNIRPDETGALRVRDAQSFVDASGSRSVTGTRDDISIKWSRDGYATALTRVVAVPAQVGTISQNATEGRAVFATGAGSNRVCWFESTKDAVYEPGHEIFGEQTMVLLQSFTGTAEVRIGYMEDDGSGNILNGIGQGIDATGLFYWRIKNSVEVTHIYSSAGNRDHLDGVEPSLFRRAGKAVAYNPLMNALYRTIFEWLGISPPSAGVQSPEKPIIEWNVEETSDSQTGTTVPEPALPMALRLFSGTMSAGVSVETGSWVGGIYTNKVLPQPSTFGDTGQVAVGLVANQVAPGPLANRTSLRITNSASSARSLFYGFSAGVTTGNGDELAPGASVDLDVGEFVKVYVITTSTAGGGVNCTWVQLA